jgi:hypothetical protein
MWCVVIVKMVVHVKMGNMVCGECGGKISFDIPLTRASSTSMPSISPLSPSPLLLLLLLPSLLVVGPAQAPPLASLRKVGNQSATWTIPSNEEPCRVVGMMFGEPYTNAALWTEP